MLALFSNGAFAGPQAAENQNPPQPKPIKAVKEMMVPLTSLEKKPEGGWKGVLGWGREKGLKAGARGDLIREPTLISATDPKTNQMMMLIRSLAWEVGECVITSLQDTTATVDIGSGFAEKDPPTAHDLCRLPVEIPGEAFQGVILDLAANGVSLTDTSGSTNYTSVSTALALRTREDEQALFARMAPELQADQPPEAKEALGRTIDKGHYAGQTVRAVLASAGVQDLEDFLRYVRQSRRQYVGTTLTVIGAFSEWALFDGGQRSRETIELRAQSLSRQADLEAYLKQLASQEEHFIWMLDPWSVDALQAATTQNADRVTMLARLFRANEAATGFKAYGVLAQVIEGVLLTSQGKAKEGAAAIEKGVKLADDLTDDPGFDSGGQKSGDDPTRTYWKAWALRCLAQAYAKIPNYAQAANAAEESLKVLFARPLSQTRKWLAVDVYYESAEYYAEVGDYALTEKRLGEAIEAKRSLSGQERALTEEIALGTPLADLASDQGDYRKAIERRNEALAKAQRYGFTESAMGLSVGLGVDYWRAGDYAKALALFEGVLPGYRQQKNPDRISIVERDIGLVYSDMGQFDKAEAMLEEALRTADSAGLGVRAAWAEQGRAEVLKRQNRLDESVAAYERAIGRVDPMRDRDALAKLYSEYALMLAEAKRAKAAEDAYLKSIALYKDLGKYASRNRQYSRLADLYRNTGRVAEAEEILAEVAKAQRESGDRNGLAWTLTDLAQIHFRARGDFAQSRKELDEAVQIATETADAACRAYARQVLAEYYATIGEEKSSLGIFQEDIEAAEARKDAFRVAELNWELGTMAMSMENTPMASERFTRALKYFQEHNWNAQAAGVLLEETMMSLWSGNLDEARSRLAEAKKAMGHSAPDSLQASLFSAESRLAVREGNNKRAVERLSAAEELWKRVSNVAGQLDVLLQRGLLEMDQREYEAARENWHAMLPLCENRPLFQALASANMAETLAGLGEFDEAESTAKKAIEQADTLALSPYVASEVRASWGLQLLDRARKTDKAENRVRYVDESTRLLNEAESRARSQNSLHTLLDVYIGRGRRQLLLAEDQTVPGKVSVMPSVPPAEESAPLDQAVQLAAKLGCQDCSWESLYLRGSLRHTEKDTEGAIADLESSLKVLERQAENHAAVGGVRIGTRVNLADKRRPFLRLLELYQQQNSDLEKDAANAAAKGFAEDAEKLRKQARDATVHARDALDRLRRFEIQSMSSGLKTTGESDDTRQKVTAYQDQIRRQMESERRLAAEYQHVPPREGIIKTLEEEISQQRSAVDREAQLIRKQYPEVAQQLELDPENPDAFVRSLTPEEALVEPVLTTDRLVVFVARNLNEEVSVRTIAAVVDSRRVAADLRALWGSAASPDSHFDPAASEQPGSPAHLSATLYDLLFAPAEPALEGVKTVLVSATGPLRYVPFHLLLARDPNGKREYLSDRYNIVYLTRRGIANGYAPGVKYSGATVVAVANPSAQLPLPEADAEVEAIQGIWAQATPEAAFEPMHGANATAGAVSTLLMQVKDRTRGQRIFHIATHGKAGALPRESFLLLADGEVHQDELRQKLGLGRAGISMAVLSGCETAYAEPGTGPGEEGAGLTGLAYGFEGGGVKTVLGTLWKLDSQTGPVFMRDFYAQLATGSSAAEALAETRKKVRRDKPHPYYWAPFILIGQWR